MGPLDFHSALYGSAMASPDYTPANLDDLISILYTLLELDCIVGVYAADLNVGGSLAMAGKRKRGRTKSGATPTFARPSIEVPGNENLATPEASTSRQPLKRIYEKGMRSDSKFYVRHTHKEHKKPKSHSSCAKSFELYLKRPKRDEDGHVEIVSDSDPEDTMTSNISPFTQGVIEQQRAYFAEVDAFVLEEEQDTQTCAL